jgi:hypothetical protein
MESEEENNFKRGLLYVVFTSKFLSKLKIVFQNHP